MIIETKYNIGDSVYIVTHHKRDTTISGPHVIKDIVLNNVRASAKERLYAYDLEDCTYLQRENILARTFKDAMDEVVRLRKEAGLE